jgi:Bacterial Ig-like domain (group 2)
MSFKKTLVCLFLFVAAVLVGCGGDSDSVVIGTQTVGSPPALLTLRLSDSVARTADASITRIRLTGTSTTGALVFGPTVEERRPENSWEIPISTTRLIIEFMADDVVVGVYSVAVDLQPGQNLVIEDPDFLDAASPLLNVQVLADSSVYPVEFNPRLTARGVFEDGSTADLSQTAAWSVIESTVADIDSTGLLSPKTPGQVTVRAQVLDLSGELVLTISDAQLHEVLVDPASFKIAAATGTTLQAKARYSDGTVLDLTEGVTWASALEAIASVDAIGKVVGQIPGTTQITATYKGHSGTAQAVISSAILTELTVSPRQSTVSAGGSTAFQAEGRFSDGTTQDMTEFITWGSSNAAVATVESNGLANGAGPGQALIIANDPESDVMASATLTVTTVPNAPSVATTLVFSGVPDTVSHGSTISPVSVSVLDQFGQPMPQATGTVTLSLSVPPAPPTPASFQTLAQTTGSGTTGSGTTGSGTTGSGTTGSGTTGSGTTGSGTTGSGSSLPPDGTMGPSGEVGLNGTLSKPLVNGVATFDDLVIYTAGTYVFHAEMGAAEGTSNIFTVTFP